MNIPSTSTGILAKNRPSVPSTANTVEVSAVDSDGKRVNVSVECLSTPPRLLGMRESRRRRRKGLLDSARAAAALSPESRPLSQYKKSGKRSGKSDPTAIHTNSPTKISSPRSAKHSRLQHKLRNCVLESDPDQLRQKLREAQDKILVLEQKLQLKGAEMTGAKRREHDLRNRERTLFSQLREATDQLQDTKEDRDSMQERYRNVKREAKNRKAENAEKDAQIKLLTCRLNELKNLETNNITENRNSQTLPTDKDEPLPSTSSGTTTNSTVMNEGNIFQDIMSNFREMLENELQCSICNEVYAFATAITCGHTFCEDCIQKWMVKKMNCPECRAQIRNHLPNKVLDSYIEKFIENFVPNDFQVTRKMLLEERKAKMDSRTPVNLPPTSHHGVGGFDQVVDPEVSGFTLTDTESDTSSDDIDSIPEFVPRRGLGLNSTNLGYTSSESNDSLLALDW